jgi:hypothetical protein
LQRESLHQNEVIEKEKAARATLEMQLQSKNNLLNAFTETNTNETAKQRSNNNKRNNTRFPDYNYATNEVIYWRTKI